MECVFISKNPRKREREIKLHQPFGTVLYLSLRSVPPPQPITYISRVEWGEVDTAGQLNTRPYCYLVAKRRIDYASFYALGSGPLLDLALCWLLLFAWRVCLQTCLLSRKVYFQDSLSKSRINTYVSKKFSARFPLFRSLLHAPFSIITSLIVLTAPF